MPDRTATATALAGRIRSALGDSYFQEVVTPMAALTLRFSGMGGHVGRAVDDALTAALAVAPAAVSYRGMLTSGTKWMRLAAPKPISGAGRTLLAKAFAAMRGMPKQATQLYFKDGDPKALSPARFAIYVGLAANHRETFATGRGMMSIAFSLDELGHARWLALGDQLFARLGAATATLGPALWLAPHCLFNRSTNQFDNVDRAIEVFASDPQLDVPSWLACRSPFTVESYRPGMFDGFVSPSWWMWIERPLAGKLGAVKKLTRVELAGGAVRLTADTTPPFAMTEPLYAKWCAAWRELAPLHLAIAGETDAEAALYLRKFAAPSLAALGDGWRAARDHQRAQTTADREIATRIRALTEPLSGDLIDYVTPLIARLTADHLWYLLPALRTLVNDGRLTRAEAGVWLDVAEQRGELRLGRRMAAVAVAAGDHARAIDILARAIKARRLDGSVKSLKTDRDFTALRKLPKFVKLVAD